MNKRIVALLGCCLLFGPQIGLATESAAMCGGIAGTKCSAAGEYCAFGVGTCKTPDAAGVCKTKPQLCPENYLPVCGCDGKTYSNACMAAAAGVSIDHLGMCKKAD